MNDGPAGDGSLDDFFCPSCGAFSSGALAGRKQIEHRAARSPIKDDPNTPATTGNHTPSSQARQGEDSVLQGWLAGLSVFGRDGCRWLLGLSFVGVVFFPLFSPSPLVLSFSSSLFFFFPSLPFFPFLPECFFSFSRFPSFFATFFSSLSSFSFFSFSPSLSSFFSSLVASETFEETFP